MIKQLSIGLIALLVSLQSFSGDFFGSDEKKPRSTLFIGVDLSGSFLKGPHFADSMNFLAHYIFSHLNGYGGLAIPKNLFIGSIGGSNPNDPKTFFPIQTFDGKSVEEIKTKLSEIFPRDKESPYTDFNAFFEHVSSTVKMKNLIMRPISIVLISDGKPDFPDQKESKEKHSVRRIVVKPLELLSRNVTIRLLFTDPVTAKAWQDKLPRQRIKIWTQDAAVMSQWKEDGIFQPDLAIEAKKKFFDWLKDNVNFPVKMKRVD